VIDFICAAAACPFDGAGVAAQRVEDEAFQRALQTEPQ
jgi:hypothetical protein